MRKNLLLLSFAFVSIRWNGEREGHTLGHVNHLMLCFMQVEMVKLLLKRKASPQVLSNQQELAIGINMKQM